MSDSLWPHGLYSPWNSLSQNTGVGSRSLLLGTLLTQGLNQVSWIAGRFFTSLDTKEAFSKQIESTILDSSHCSVQFSSITQLCPTLCDPKDCSRPPCPSPTPRVCSNSCPLSQSCHPTILILCCPLLFLPSIFPSIRSFQMSQHFASGGQNIGVSASASVLPVNIQDWFPLGWTGLISLQSKGLSTVFSNITVQKYQFFIAQLSL